MHAVATETIIRGETSMKTGEENSSLGMALGALATATGLGFLAKRKKNEE